MDAKLTLKLNKSIIEKAKDYAASHNKSLSRMVESYLQGVIEKESEELEISPYVKSLQTGINIPEDYDYKKEYRHYLEKKYK